MNSKSFYVYVHRNAVTGEVFYVGKGAGGRFEASAGRSKRWHAVKSDVGFKAEIVHSFADEDLAFQLEKDLIKHYRGVGAPLVNVSDGGQGASGARRTDETKKLMSQAARNRKSKSRHTEASKEKLRQANIGKKMSADAVARTTAAHKGAKRGAETIERMRIAQKKAALVRRKAEWTEEMRRAMSEKSKGRKLSDEARAKMSAAALGKKKRPQSPEHIAKRVEAFNRAIEKRRAAKLNRQPDLDI